MRATHDAVHVSVPARDLDEAVTFYQGGLGATVARRYADPVTVACSADQPVGHLSNDLPGRVEPYPHHVGVTVTDGGDVDPLLRVLEYRTLPVPVSPAPASAGRPRSTARSPWPTPRATSSRSRTAWTHA